MSLWSHSIHVFWKKKNKITPNFWTIQYNLLEKSAQYSSFVYKVNIKILIKMTDFNARIN